MFSPLGSHQHLGLVVSHLRPVLASEVVDVVAVHVAEAARGLEIKFHFSEIFLQRQVIFLAISY